MAGGARRALQSSDFAAKWHTFEQYPTQVPVLDPMWRLRERFERGRELLGALVVEQHAHPRVGFVAQPFVGALHVGAECEPVCHERLDERFDRSRGDRAGTRRAVAAPRVTRADSCVPITWRDG